jgi:eukaryotic-like serine/threonine-protein kinase
MGLKPATKLTVVRISIKTTELYMHRNLDLGQIVGDHYLIVDSIGQGAMADIHLAHDQRDGRKVALKWLVCAHRDNTAYRERLRIEAELLAQVKHPNVIQLYDCGVAPDGLPYLVMEALQGETLHEYISRRGAMPAHEALPLVMQLGRALQAVHDAGLIHGDVKPHNIFLCGELDKPESIKLIDFGFAQSSATDTPVEGDIVAGTLEYMAPEQLLSEPIDARSDIYSFGIVLFRWLTAELPFASGATLGLFAHHLASKPPPPSWLVDGMPPGLEKVILACMRKNPANRYACMPEVLIDLSKVLTGAGDVQGVPMHQVPDEYRPLSEQGRRAFKILHRAGLSVPALG